MNTLQITESEAQEYYRFGYTNSCDLCHNDYPIHKYDFNNKDNENYIEYNGKQFLCVRCRS